MGQKSKNNNERNNTHQFKRAMITGFVGGTFWSSISIILYYFNFIEVSIKSYVLSPIIESEWVSSWQGDLLSILIIGCMSILVSIVYYLLFKKYNTMWAGVIYGIGLWFVFYYFVNPMYGDIPTLAEFNNHTIVSTLSLYCLYGVFVGYSISFDYNDNRMAVRVNDEKQ